jgi:hypothetical protein
MSHHDQQVEATKPGALQRWLNYVLVEITALRLLNWLVVGLWVLALSQGSMILCAWLLGELPADTVSSFRSQPPSLQVAFIALQVAISPLLGAIIDRKAPRLAIQAPQRLVKHGIFAVLYGLLLGLGVYGFFKEPHQGAKFSLLWYVRDTYPLLAAITAYWLAYEIPWRPKTAQ